MIADRRPMKPLQSVTHRSNFALFTRRQYRPEDTVTRFLDCGTSGLSSSEEIEAACRLDNARVRLDGRRHVPSHSFDAPRFGLLDPKLSYSAESRAHSRSESRTGNGVRSRRDTVANRSRSLPPLFCHTCDVKSPRFAKTVRAGERSHRRLEQGQRLFRAPPNCRARVSAEPGQATPTV